VARRLAAGDALAFDSTHVHAMYNSSEADALNVHVYSPPLSTMTYFEHRTGSQLLSLARAAVWRGHVG